MVKNGFTSYGKQNYRCHRCKRQAVERALAKRFSREDLLETLLLERLSLRAIARILQVSLGWVIKRFQQCWQTVPERLPTGKMKTPELALYCLEADELWSFVGAKDCPEWLWPQWNGWL
ncbi:IS1/IS1595 family N-terminal zinc-binding domain-containing protein [Tunicatimonas sp.]|uniref:IS1/IS1595 family N-terminal zinc-binding domain-containing protein n=1 Tax=Tunicatimonas sp. TaxID=1940096 RepID=UPI003C740D37